MPTTKETTCKRQRLNFIDFEDRHRGAMCAVSHWQINSIELKRKFAPETWPLRHVLALARILRRTKSFNVFNKHTYMFSVLFISFALRTPNDPRIAACASPFHQRQAIIVSGERTGEIVRINILRDVQ